MADPIYFQWQNPYLLRTIYPLRELKLRDFLAYFYEVQVWNDLKARRPAELAGEVQAYCAAQRDLVLKAFQDYQQLETYFLDTTIASHYQQTEGFPEVDDKVLYLISELHRVFKQYFPNYKNAVKEKYFISERVRQFEDLQKRYQSERSYRQRILNSMTANNAASSAAASAKNDVDRLTNITLKMVEKELNKLYAFLAAYERLGRYRQDVIAWRAAKEKERDTAAARQKTIDTESAALQTSLVAAQRGLSRLKNPPAMADMKAYFFQPDVSGAYLQRYPNLDASVLAHINDLHRVFLQLFPNMKSTQMEQLFIGQRIKELEETYKQRQDALALTQRTAQWALSNPVNRAKIENDLQSQRAQVTSYGEEIDRLVDFQWAYQRSGKTAIEINSQTAQKEKECAALEAQVQSRKAEAATLTAVLLQLNQALNATEQEQILARIDPAAVTVQDIARRKVEKYKADLLNKTHEELLNEIVQIFMQQPERFPLWLQYMVIHFSGMRYQSAHGSWADPKDLLLSLRTKMIEEKMRDEVKRGGQDAIDALCEQRYRCYLSVQESTSVLGKSTDEENPPPELALTSDPDWKAKIEYYLKALNPDGGYNKFKALLDLLIDEEDYRIQQGTPKQALDGLEDLKDQLPDFMWKEIVKLTDLKLTEVSDVNWEQLSAEDIEQRYSWQMRKYREILDTWKRDHLTGWREEHEQTSQLVVSGAVCNEVAEHIQHIRGLTPPGGLTAKPEWYLSKEKDPVLAAGADRPFLIKPQNASDFKPGASILWLQWVRKEPSIWQIARPLSLKNGEELVPLLSDSANTIKSTGSAYLRTSHFSGKDPDGRVYDRTDTQWLRWIHEATVVEVAEMIDGTAVLTFETALPNDDRRQSSIGLFQRFAVDLRCQITASEMRGILTGYIPQELEHVPYDNLREMLDWNHILLREAYTLAQIEQYWQKMVKRPAVPRPYALPEYVEETLFEVAPPLLPQEHKEWILCYQYNEQQQCMQVYQPWVALKRGTQISAAKPDARQMDGVWYYPITQCAREPRAKTLYARADALIEASSRPVRAHEETLLYQLCNANAAMKPVFEPGENSLPAGTRFRVSSAHKISPADEGNGAIHSASRQQYLLVVECPRKRSAEGLFIRRGDALKISEKQYAEKVLEL